MYPRQSFGKVAQEQHGGVPVRKKAGKQLPRDGVEEDGVWPSPKKPSIWRQAFRKRKRKRGENKHEQNIKIKQCNI
jgi:hypothetical protein